MNGKVKTELRLTRKDGVSHSTSCNAPNWDREFHNAMLLLQANPPKDIQVRCKTVHGVQEWTLIDLQPDDRPIPLNSVGCAIDPKTGIIYPLLDDGLIDDKSPFEIEGMTKEWHKGLTSEDKQTIMKVKEAIFRDAESPEKCTQVCSEVQAKLNLIVFQAYQHFLFYIDISHLEKADIWGGHMTTHFIEKLRGFINRTEEGYIRIDAVVKWVQEMTPSYQAILLDYIMKYHSNKW